MRLRDRKLIRKFGLKLIIQLPRLCQNLKFVNEIYYEDCTSLRNYGENLFADKFIFHYSKGKTACNKF